MPKPASFEHSAHWRGVVFLDYFQVPTTVQKQRRIKTAVYRHGDKHCGLTLLVYVNGPKYPEFPPRRLLTEVRQTNDRAPGNQETAFKTTAGRIGSDSYVTFVVESVKAYDSPLATI